MILWGNTLLFYKNRQLEPCELVGDRECLYLLESSEIRNLKIGDDELSLLLYSPFSPIRLITPDKDSCSRWFSAFQFIISTLSKNPPLRGFMFKPSKSKPEDSSKKRYFILNSFCVSVYRAASDVSLSPYSNQPVLEGDCDLSLDEGAQLISLTESLNGHRSDKRKQ